MSSKAFGGEGHPRSSHTYTHTDTHTPVCLQRTCFLRNQAKNLLAVFQPACQYQERAQGLLESCKMKFSFPFEGILCLKLDLGSTDPRTNQSLHCSTHMGRRTGIPGHSPFILKLGQCPCMCWPGTANRFH